MFLVTQLVKLKILLVLLCIWLAGCVYFSSNARQDGVVIERNKEIRPAWADAPTEQLLYTSSETRFHYSVLKARDLPIAVKKSQTAAIEASFGLWRPIFERRVAENPIVKSTKPQIKSSREFSEVIDRFAHQMHAQIAQIEDIYFEKVKIDAYNPPPELEGATEYFDVHTLVHLLPIDGDNFYHELANHLQSSRNSEVRRTGKEISQSLSKNKKLEEKSKRPKARKKT